MAKSKKNKKDFHHWFIPHKHNDYRPHAFRHWMLTLYSFILLSAQVIFGVAYVSGPSLAAGDATAIKQDVIALTNNERQENNLNSLSENVSLDQAAEAKLNDMFQENYWEHVSPEGKQAWDFINATDYQYVYAGENLARGFVDAKTAMKAWMNSPSHKKNILNSEYQDIGVAVGYGKINDKSTVLIVQMFGAQAKAVAGNEVNNSSASNQIIGKAKTSPSISASNLTIFQRMPYLVFWMILFALIIFDGISVRRLGLHKSKKDMFEFRVALLINIFVLLLLSINYVSIA